MTKEEGRRTHPSKTSTRKTKTSAPLAPSMAKNNTSEASKDWKEKRRKKEGPERSLAEEEEVKKIKKIEKKKDKKQKKVYDLPGQTHDTPDERDPLRIFFEMLYRQLPDNELAASWMMEWGLLPPDQAKMVHEKLQNQKSLQEKLDSPDKTATLEKASTRSAKKKSKMTSETTLKAKKRKHVDSNSDGGHDDSISQKKKNKKLKVAI